MHSQNTVETALKALLAASAELEPEKISSYRLPRWDQRTHAIIKNFFGGEEVEKFEHCLMNAKKSLIFNENLRVRRVFIIAFWQDVKKHPDHYFPSSTALVGGAIATPSAVIGRQFSPAPDSRKVFIIHGHDETNVLRLKDFLRENLNLAPVVLSSQVGASATIIEKFEQEAKDAFFAFAIFTPDDHVDAHGETYAQPRPNAIFELGWFFRHLERNGVCILLKHGTKMHSDLGGVQRIEFSNSVLEKTDEIRREIEAVQRKRAR